MSAPVHIRPARPDDDDAIRAVLVAAFPSDAEARLVQRLHKDGDVVCSLVAVAPDSEQERVVGHVLMSKMQAPMRALALAPLAVLRSHERRGIGALLVRAALDDAARAHWQAAFVLGDPKYYARFGFHVDAAAGFSSPYAGPHFMAVALAGPWTSTSGTLAHAPAFAAL